MTENISEIWRVFLSPDEGANDSDKSFTIPTNTEWELLWIWVELVTSADVGNRQLEVRVQDAAGDLIGILAVAGTTQAASLTRNYLFAPGAADMTAFRDTDFISNPIPRRTMLEAGQVLRIWDNNAVAAGVDDMVIQLQFNARAVI